MAIKSFNRDTAANCEVNMTPLIDVSLVLVVMLILATPLAFESRIDVSSAARSGRKAHEEKPSERVEIIIENDDNVRVNNTAVKRTALESALQPLMAASVDHGVFVGCEPGVSHGAFVNVLDQARESGATDIAVFDK
ncbi:MAG TPA: biopolymer transporter ExbD [Candidatus Krumholzibacteria bacterium]|nr:biopolymer transporter ExbD [Candidatus Krumholzibacteria bacterium]